MSATRRNLFPSALMLVLLLTVATPASGQGIWSYNYWTDGVYGHRADDITLSIVNLTTQKLVVTSPSSGSSWDTYCQQNSLDYVCRSNVSYPFQESSSTLNNNPDWQAANGVLYINPYRSATWGSRTAWASAGDYAWTGAIAIYPAGKIGNQILGQLFTFAVGARQQAPDPGAYPVLNRNTGRGTWWFLYGGNASYWSPVVSAYNHGIYLTPFELDSMYNVMTKMSVNGELTVSLFAGANDHPVLVVRENLGQDYMGWDLDFVDQPSDSVPQTIK